MSEIVIGTANFGNDYGILNIPSKGQVTLEHTKAVEILKYCKSIGIRKFDTALTYGESSNILESFLDLDTEIEIFHKITWVGGSKEDFTEYQKTLINLLNRPIGKAIKLMQWHNWDGDSSDLISLQDFQKKFQDNYDIDFGVTTYGVKNAITASSSQIFKNVQFEYNILNQSVIRALIENNLHRNSRYSMRSILLQGLLATDKPIPSKLPEKLIEAISKFKTVCDKWALTTLEVSIRSKLNFKLETDLVIGITSIDEIDKINDVLSRGALPEALFNELSIFNEYDSSVADPRYWNLR
jgi:aryl-alcohol dehydrogenase-like predicted oxidoreductase